MADRKQKLELLRVLIEHSRQLPQQTRFESSGHPLRENPEPIDRIEYCSQAFLSGALPDAETLMFLAESFFDYIHSSGEKSLDTAFQLQSIQRAGNPSKQRARQNERLSLLFDMACARVDDDTLSIEAAAEAVSPNSELVDTLMRDYRRNNCHEWESMITSLSSESSGK